VCIDGSYVVSVSRLATLRRAQVVDCGVRVWSVRQLLVTNATVP